MEKTETRKLAEEYMLLGGTRQVTTTRPSFVNTTPSLRRPSVSGRTVLRCWTRNAETTWNSSCRPSIPTKPSELLTHPTNY
ncbi:hypothetical protein J2Z84_002024 [Agrobacterium rubi]|nr:hypothetical protein [Agrobacterium rubi]